MYESMYNLSTLPFENTADPRFFYASEQHREALSAIEYTIRLRKGIVLITGDIGSGKTTVGRTMIDRCSGQSTIIKIHHGHQDGDSILRQVLRAMKMSVNESTEHSVLLDSLGKVVRQHASEGRPMVLLVDEAQTLGTQALEELRLFCDMDTTESKLIQLVLVGQPELRDCIMQPQMAALRQRIFMAKQLSTLTINETAGYIAHRIKAASLDPENIKVSFNGEAIRTIYGFTHGVPRLINVACDNCLLLGFVKQTDRITGTMARQVVSEMLPSFAMEQQQLAEQRPPLRMAGNF